MFDNKASELAGRTGDEDGHVSFSDKWSGIACSWGKSGPNNAYDQFDGYDNTYA
ncbi:hypothetical protein MACH01_23350 [Thalassospira tepidiphila]|nr:hypothetical protein MACH01_23350 [Thalassospira tepidiphila]